MIVDRARRCRFSAPPVNATLDEYMTSGDGRYDNLAARCRVPRRVGEQLQDAGFVVIPGPNIAGGVERLSEVYDQAVAMADPADVRVSSSTRVIDFVNRAPEFDDIYIYEPLLAACCMIIGEPFKLSGTRMRTLAPGARTQALHVDVTHGNRAEGWPIVGFILMVDAFDAANGATRFVPGSQLLAHEPSDLLTNPAGAHQAEVLACGPAGSMIIFNGSAWHGHAANHSTRRRRSLQGHFIPRHAQSSVDHSARTSSEVLERIGELGRYILSVG